MSLYSVAFTSQLSSQVFSAGGLAEAFFALVRQLLRMRTFQGFWAQYGRHLVGSLLCLPSKKGPNTMISYCVVLAFVLGAEARLEFPERYAGRKIVVILAFDCID